MRRRRKYRQTTGYVNSYVWPFVGGDLRPATAEQRMEIQDNSTELYLTHTDWVSADGWFGTCNALWGILLYRLKDYAEGKTPGPFFKGKTDLEGITSQNPSKLLKKPVCRLVKKISEARRAKNRRAEAYLGGTLERGD